MTKHVALNIEYQFLTCCSSQNVTKKSNGGDKIYSKKCGQVQEIEREKKHLHFRLYTPRKFLLITSVFKCLIRCASRFYFKKHTFSPRNEIWERIISSCTQCSITFTAISTDKQTNTNEWMLHTVPTAYTQLNKHSSQSISKHLGMKRILHTISRDFLLL